MAVELQSPPEPGTAALMKGIVSDFGDLMKQHLRFAQAEFKEDLRKTGQASGLMALGFALVFLSLIVLIFMLVYLLHWLTLPAGADPAGLPLWASHGIVGGLILVTGVVLVLAGKAKFKSFNPLPDQTLQVAKENVEWITNSK
jgi:hypothetical protein